MNRVVAGALAALLLVAAGLFWWQGRAQLQRGAPPPTLGDDGSAADALPIAGEHGRGAPLPALPKAAKSPKSAEERAFNRYDKRHNGQFGRTQMLATRVKAFQKLDTNHDNLLSFEEWAVKTSDKFAEMDANHDGAVSREEFHAWYVLHHRPKGPKAPRCACSPAPEAALSDGDLGDPGQ